MTQLLNVIKKSGCYVYSGMLEPNVYACMLAQPLSELRREKMREGVCVEDRALGLDL